MNGIVRGQEPFNDYEEIIEFANFVFSYAHNPHEFKTLIPKTYGDGRTQFPEHFTVRENGRIRGLVGLLEYDQRVLDETLRVGYIGTVSVHPYTRGRGYMKDCMARAMDYARENGDDLLVLFGLRQRYGYYGFENAGTVHKFTITKTNCRQAMNGADTRGITFQPMADASVYTDSVYTLWTASPVTCTRGRDNFAQICSSWYDRPYVILRGDAFIGYCVVSADRETVHELRLCDSTDFNAVLKAYITGFAKDAITLCVPPYRTEDIRSAARVCESVSSEPCGMVRVLRYDRVVAAYLKLKQSIEGTLPDGRIVLGITENGTPRALSVAVRGGEVECGYTQDAPDIVLNETEALNLLFAPVSFVDKTALPDCAYRYFPLPFYMEHSDMF